LFETKGYLFCCFIPSIVDACRIRCHQAHRRPFGPIQWRIALSQSNTQFSNGRVGYHIPILSESLCHLTVRASALSDDGASKTVHSRFEFEAQIFGFVVFLFFCRSEKRSMSDDPVDDVDAPQGDEPVDGDAPPADEAAADGETPVDAPPEEPAQPPPPPPDPYKFNEKQLAVWEKWQEGSKDAEADLEELKKTIAEEMQLNIFQINKIVTCGVRVRSIFLCFVEICSSGTSCLRAIVWTE
jgi:hypothetical protein